MEYRNLIACPECDLLHRSPGRLGRFVARCSRCGASLRGIERADQSVDTICALTVATLITFLVAQAFPVIELEANGMSSHATLFEAVARLWSGQMRLVAALVFCSTVVFPLAELLALLYVLVPLRAGRIPPHFHLVIRLVELVRPWGMIEVFMLGTLVTVVKMVSLARVIPEPGIFAFGALSLLFAIVAAFDPGSLWQVCDDIHRRGGSAGQAAPEANVSAVRTRTTSQTDVTDQLPATASRAGVIACHACGLVATRADSVAHQRCSRCDAILHTRSPESLARTAALLMTAALLYIPANLLPVMHTTTLGHDEDDTILGGVAYFWTSGDWPLAVIVFVASVMVPMLKLGILTLQTVAAYRGSPWRPIERARLYRIVERVGRWSMLDVFVVALTVALVHFGSLAVVTAGPGALAFGAVVVFTMLASSQFDPRLIWDDVK